MTQLKELAEVSDKRLAIIKRHQYQIPIPQIEIDKSGSIDEKAKEDRRKLRKQYKINRELKIEINDKKDIIKRQSGEIKTLENIIKKDENNLATSQQNYNKLEEELKQNYSKLEVELKQIKKLQLENQQ